MGSLPMEPERGLARRQVGHFEILPPHAPPPARADGFHARLLGRESSGKTFVTVSLPLDVRDLGRRVNPLDEAPAMALDGRPNPRNFGQIHSRAHNHLNSPSHCDRYPNDAAGSAFARPAASQDTDHVMRSEEHTSELQSRQYLVC